MASRAEILAATRSKWLKGATDLTMQKRAWLAMMKQKGSIDYSCSGDYLEFTIKNDIRNWQAHTDYGQITYQPSDLHDKALIEWVGLTMVDVYSKLDKLKNRGDEARVKLIEGMLKGMQKDAAKSFGKLLFKDKDVTANAGLLWGFLSFTSHNTQTATDEEATTLNDSYANHSTSRTTKTSVTTAEAYGYWSPTKINATVTGETWAANADHQMRRLISRAGADAAAENRLDLVMCPKTSYELFLNLAEQRQQQYIRRGDNLSLVKLGYDGISYDGVQVTYDDDIPATDTEGATIRAIGLNFDHCGIKCMTKNLFDDESMGGEKDIDQLTTKFLMTFHGNLWFHPKFQGMIGELTGT